MSNCPDCTKGNSCTFWGSHIRECRKPSRVVFPTWCLLGTPKPDEKADAIDSPSHYNEYPVEVIKMIEAIFKVTFGGDYTDQPLWKVAMLGYILGNELKYRLRTGFKDTEKIKEDVMKSLKYKEFRDLYA